MDWRLIVDGAQRGAWNMAVDEALVEAVDRGESAPVLRLYRVPFAGVRAAVWGG